MQFLKRFGFYLIGVALGIPFVLFIWKEKDVTFDYGMDARTLKTIRIRKRIFSNQAKSIMQQYDIDTTQITTILKEGDVDFSKSRPRKKPCSEYLVTSKKIDLYVVRCDSTATITNVFMKQ